MSELTQGPRPLVSVFIDGLRGDWAERMPFVRSIAPIKPLQTELGYSIACHATMYTGLPPQEHGLWFVWLRDEERSPFPHWLRNVPSRADMLPLRIAAHKAFVAPLRDKYPRGYFGVPRLVNVPLRHWPGLWVSEEQFWSDEGYTAGGPTIFELARRKGLQFRTIGLDRGGNHLKSVQSAVVADEDLEWVYLFFGEVDHAAHATGGIGSHFDSTLAAVDAAIEARCNEVSNIYGSFDFLLFSDHGHRVVEKYVDIYDRVDQGFLTAVPHVVDTNYARFWPADDHAAKRLVRELGRTVPEGRVLLEEELRSWGCNFPDNRYGDVVFYLDVPCAFAKTAWGWSRSQRSIHGYLPSYDDMCGTAVTTLSSVPKNLKDIFVVHRDRLGLSDDG